MGLSGRGGPGQNLFAGNGAREYTVRSPPRDAAADAATRTVARLHLFVERGTTRCRTAASPGHEPHLQNPRFQSGRRSARTELAFPKPIRVHSVSHLSRQVG